MWAALLSVLGYIVTNFVTKALLGAGIALITYQGASTLINSVLSSMTLNVSSLPVDALDILELAGLSQILSILGSAFVSVGTLMAAGRIYGMIKQ